MPGAFPPLEMGPRLALDERWDEIVMTLFFFVFFQHPRPPSFVRPANQITLEMAVGRSSSALGGLIVCAGENRCAPAHSPAGRGPDRSLVCTGNLSVGLSVGGDWLRCVPIFFGAGRVVC